MKYTVFSPSIVQRYLGNTQTVRNSRSSEIVKHLPTRFAFPEYKAEAKRRKGL